MQDAGAAEEESSDSDGDEDDGHTFKTITERPYEEDQVTTVQHSISRARASRVGNEACTNDEALFSRG